MPRTGRPKKANARRTGLFIRLDENELATIRTAARQAAKPLSDYVRHRLCAPVIDIEKSRIPLRRKPGPQPDGGDILDEAEALKPKYGSGSPPDKTKKRKAPDVTAPPSPQPADSRPEPAVAAAVAQRIVRQQRDSGGIFLDLPDGTPLARIVTNRGWVLLVYKTSTPDRVTGLAPSKLSTIISRVLRANAKDTPAATLAAQLDARLQEAIRVRRK